MNQGSSCPRHFNISTFQHLTSAGCGIDGPSTFQHFNISWGRACHRVMVKCGVDSASSGCFVFLEFNCFRVLIDRDRPLVASYHLTILPSHAQKCHRPHLTILPSHGQKYGRPPTYHLTILPSHENEGVSFPSYHLTILRK